MGYNSCSAVIAITSYQSIKLFCPLWSLTHIHSQVASEGIAGQHVHSARPNSDLVQGQKGPRGLWRCRALCNILQFLNLIVQFSLLFFSGDETEPSSNSASHSTLAAYTRLRLWHISQPNRDDRQCNSPHLYMTAAIDSSKYFPVIPSSSSAVKRVVTCPSTVHCLFVLVDTPV